MKERLDPLREGRWRYLSDTQRLEALKELEAWQADRDGRPRASVRYPTDEERKQYRLRDGEWRGCYIEGREGPTILINPQTLKNDREESRVPYRAAETLLHEARHAYQAHAIRNPGFHDGKETATWARNKRGYIPPFAQEDRAYYPHQPLEADASKFGLRNLDHVYERIADHPMRYEAYRLERETLLQIQRRTAFRKPDFEAKLKKRIEDQIKRNRQALSHRQVELKQDSPATSRQKTRGREQEHSR